MADVTQIITVNDAVTHAALANAQVFVNGVGKGSTNGSGNITLSLPAGTFDLTIKLNGYLSFSTTGIIAPQPNIIIELEASTPVATTTLDLTVIPEDGANGMPIVITSGMTTINTNYTKGGIQVSNVPLATVTITGQAPNFQPFAASFDLNISPTIVIQMAVAEDSGGALSKRGNTAQDPILDALLLPTVTEDVPEYIAPNTSQGTYFTMTQARIYIGDLFIDELNTLQFALQDNKLPIYGYASRYWDAVAQGKSLVQGQFAINFVSEGYLIKTLDNYRDKINQQLPTDKQTAANNARLLQIVNALQNPDPNWPALTFTTLNQEFRNLAASMGPDAVNAASAQIRVDKQKQLNSVLGLPGNDYDNAVYSDVEFDIVVQYTGAGRTITRRLEKCRLISNESVMDHSGTPILDSYGFIARRLR